jgi:Chaperone of endosialidase
LNNRGNNNAATGAFALQGNTTGHDNTAQGFQSLNGNGSGSNNVAFGSHAGANLTTGNNNIDIGANVLGNAGEANTIRIGKQGTQKSTFIGGIFGTAVTGSTVVVNSNGKLGVATSSSRFKEAIKPMNKASEAILALKPVSFRYKQDIDPDGIPQFGLIAEEVEKINPDLVVRDDQGKVMTMRYEAVNAMLLNEFLKEHRTSQNRRAQSPNSRRLSRSSKSRLKHSLQRCRR